MRLLLLILCLTWMVGMGQNSQFKESFRLADSIFTDNTLPDPEYDTIAIIMLVSDTGSYVSYSYYELTPTDNPQIDSAKEIKVYSKYLGRAYGVEGHEVMKIEKQMYFYNGRQVEIGRYTAHHCYLDRDKKPLSKSRIVWQSITKHK